MADSAPVPTLNDTGPKVNLMDQWFHTGTAHTQAVQTGQSESIQLAPLPQADLSGAVPVLFSIVFIVWVIYTMVVIYHWFRYRHKSWFAVPAIVLHFFVSGTIIIFMISGLK